MIKLGCQAYRAWDYSPRLLAAGVNQQTVASVEEENCSGRVPCLACIRNMDGRPFCGFYDLMSVFSGLSL